MRPFLLKPAFKDYLWGGDILKKKYNKKTDQSIVAESWELSAHSDGSSVVATGEHTGKLFSELIKEYPEICGTNCKDASEFPILIKLIDAKNSLSIQVHPDNEYAWAVEGEQGKTEMWIVLESEPEAFFYFGFEKEITKQEMQTRIENNTLTEVLHKFPVKKGSVVYIPAGTIHAIGAGIVLAEIQQNSNSTYRVYDFGRTGPDGKLRELHIEKALAVTKLEPASTSLPGEAAEEIMQEYTSKKLVQNDYFTVKQLWLRGKYQLEVTPKSFISLLCVNGLATVTMQGQSIECEKGDSVFIPAMQGEVELIGDGEFIVTNV